MMSLRIRWVWIAATRELNGKLVSEAEERKVVVQKFVDVCNSNQSDVREARFQA